MQQPTPTTPAEPMETVSRSISVILPEMAKAGDRLSFATPAGNFTLTVPGAAVPGKSLKVAIPVPASFSPQQQLTISNIKLNNEPVPPKFSPEMLAIIQEHRMRLETHWARFPLNERQNVRTMVDLTPYKPQGAVRVPHRLGFWQVDRLAHRVDAAAAWEPHVPRALKTEHLLFGTARLQLQVQAIALPWRTATETGHDLELSVVLRRGAPAVGEPTSPISLFSLIEVLAAAAAPPLVLRPPLEPHRCAQVGDRWSNWKSVTLGVDEEFVFDLGDRRKISDLVRMPNCIMEVNLYLTSIAPGALSKQVQQHNAFAKDIKTPSAVVPMVQQQQAAMAHQAAAQAAAAQHAATQQTVHMLPQQAAMGQFVPPFR